MPALPTPRRIATWIAALAVAGAGGWVATQIGTPLPWLLGAMVATALALALDLRPAGEALSFPQLPRLAFITIIGAAIGGTAKPDVLGQFAAWWPSLVAVALFVGLAQAANYQIFRRLAGYDPATAYYCSCPGGLIESVQLGEEAGGNPALLTVQHFARIALTVTLVPVVYWLLRGEAVGSAAGVSMTVSKAPITVQDVAIIGTCCLVGAWGGRRIGFPAAIITGPIILSAIAHATGLVEAQPPDWLIGLAQLVIGLGLAMRFKGLTRRLLVTGIGLGLLSVAVMLAIGAAIAEALAVAGVNSFQVLLMCYAPGGVVEMGLIALSLGVSPMAVTLHHIVRIGFTVMAVPAAGRWVLGPPEAEPPT